MHPLREAKIIGTRFPQSSKVTMLRRIPQKTKSSSKKKFKKEYVSTKYCQS